MSVTAFFDADTVERRSDFFTGADQPPCTTGCPSQVDARGYINLISEGKFYEAIVLEKERNPLALCHGRLCNHQCEYSCTKGTEEGEPISIRLLKRFIADHEMTIPQEKRIPWVKPISKRKKIALIGSGPACLTAGDDLMNLGYDVVIFESRSVPGGYLYVGIPDYRLPKGVLMDEINGIFGKGVDIRLSTAIGKDIPFEDLRKDGYAAVMIGTGAQKPLGLGIPGDDLPGVVAGEDFIEEVCMRRSPPIGKRVAVIGAGNTGMDACRSALRQGAEEVYVLYRRTRKEMPAAPDEVEDAIEEGVRFEYLVSPIRVVGDGKVEGIELVKNKLGDPDDSGRRSPVPVQGSEYILPVDTILTAISRVPDFPWIPKEIKVNRKKGIEVDWKTGMTSIPGVFAGGDCVLGAASAIEAVAHGKRAARGIDQFLS
ncbi:MAG: NAD(P)-dependent oxidoreductase [Armatimonadetes bacterium]|nr:NAD(P)-dependent oxidoreductase [Armatimonadota bacterium]